MADRSIIFRLKPSITKMSQDFEEDETGISANHVGDVVAVVAADHEWSARERTAFGIVKVTGIPDGVMAYVMNRLVEEGWLAKVKETLPGGWAIVSNVGYRLRRPKRFRVSKVLCLAKWPALEVKINKLFDPEFEVPQDQIPSLPWSGFRQVLVDKLTGDATTGEELEEADE